MPEAVASKASSHQRSDDVVRISLTPAFKLVFLSVLSITVLSIVLSCPLALLGAASPEKSALLQACLTTWKLGFGAIIGLLGGKAL